jgi:hypothetical protein
MIPFPVPHWIHSIDVTVFFILMNIIGCLIFSFSLFLLMQICKTIVRLIFFSLGRVYLMFWDFIFTEEPKQIEAPRIFYLPPPAPRVDGNLKSYLLSVIGTNNGDPRYNQAKDEIRQRILSL